MPAITSTAAMIHKMVSVLPPPFAASIPRTPNMLHPSIPWQQYRGCRSFADFVTLLADAFCTSAHPARAHGSTRMLLHRTDRVARCTVMSMGGADSTTCPICGEGTLRTVDFGEQQPESRQVQTFTCGHEVEGARLQTADGDRLDVERRASGETVTPVDADE